MNLLNSSKTIWCCLTLPLGPCRFSKTGDMVFVGHLDLMKTFDRACRRAVLPISGAALVRCGLGDNVLHAALGNRQSDPDSFAPPNHAPGPPLLPSTADESPFAVRQRIYAALPLPLGATSAGEWLELTLTEKFEPEAIRSRLQVGGGAAAEKQREEGPAGMQVLAAAVVGPPHWHLIGCGLLVSAAPVQHSACPLPHPGLFGRVAPPCRPSCRAACSCCLLRRPW